MTDLVFDAEQVAAAEVPRMTDTFIVYAWNGNWWGIPSATKHGGYTSIEGAVAAMQRLASCWTGAKVFRLGEAK